MSPEVSVLSALPVYFAVAAVLSAPIFGALGAIVGGAKGRSGLSAALGILLGPIGILIAVLLPDSRKTVNRVPELFRHYSVAHHGVEQDTDDFLTHLGKLR